MQFIFFPGAENAKTKAMAYRYSPHHDMVTCNHHGAVMSTSNRARSSRDKVRAHRERLRRQGLRPVQIWVPDVRAPGFAVKAHRQSFAVAKSRHVNEDQAFIDDISEWDAS